MQTFAINVNGVRAFELQADFANAACPIMLDGEATPFQVADAGHDPRTAAALLNRWANSEGGAYWGPGDVFTIAESSYQ